MQISKCKIYRLDSKKCFEQDARNEGNIKKYAYKQFTQALLESQTELKKEQKDKHTMFSL